MVESGELRVVFRLQNKIDPMNDAVSCDFAFNFPEQAKESWWIKLAERLREIWSPEALDILDFDWCYDRLDGDVTSIPSGHIAYVRHLSRSDEEQLKTIATETDSFWVFNRQNFSGSNAEDEIEYFRRYCKILRSAKN